MVHTPQSEPLTLVVKPGHRSARTGIRTLDLYLERVATLPACPHERAPARIRTLLYWVKASSIRRNASEA